VLTVFVRNMFDSRATGTADIVDGNLKLILGLVWTLILHYQISARFTDEDFTGGKPGTARQSMLNYVQVSLASTQPPSSHLILKTASRPTLFIIIIQEGESVKLL